jgi:hypothetical protein
MDIWIVEDNDTHARNAAEAVLRAVADADRPPRSINLWRNATVHWGSPLLAIDITATGVALTDRAAPKLISPRIVILDMYDSNAAFTGADFLDSLRSWQREHGSPEPYVALWSLWGGNADLHHFVSTEPRRNPRVQWLDTKGTASLADKIKGFLNTLAQEHIR